MYHYKYLWNKDRVIQIASAKSQSELIDLLKEHFTIAEQTYSVVEAMRKGLELGYFEIGQNLATLFLHLQKSFGNPFPIDYNTVLASQNIFSWPYFIQYFARHRGSYFYSVNAMIPYLLESNQLKLSDVAERPITAFYVTLLRVRDPAQYPEAIYKILTKNNLSRSDRMNMLYLMKIHGKLSLQPCGPEKVAAPIYCILLAKQYLLPFFTDLPGLAQCRGPAGERYLELILQRHPYFSYLKPFTKDELKSMLYETPNVVNKMIRFRECYLSNAFVAALKELLEEGKLNNSDVQAFADLFDSTLGARFVYRYSGKLEYTSIINEYEEVHQSYYRSKEKQYCIGETSFPFEELPLEIIKIICEELNSQDFFGLFAASKYLQTCLGRIDDRFYRLMMQKRFMNAFCSLNASANKVNWRHQFNVHSRRAYRWNTCSEPKQIVIKPEFRTENFDRAISFDENWLLIRIGYCATGLWNTHDQKMYTKSHAIFSGDVSYGVLESPELQFPTLVALGYRCSKVIRFKDNEVSITQLKKEWNSYYVTAISSNRILTGFEPEVYDVESDQVVLKADKLKKVVCAAHNKSNQLTILATPIDDYDQQSNSRTDNIYVVDKNFQITHALKTKQTGTHGRITWLDETMFLLQEYDSYKICDLRKSRDFVHENSVNGNFSSGYKPIFVTPSKYLQYWNTGSTTGYNIMMTNQLKKLGCVWNLSDGTWSNVIVLPDNWKGQPICNSRYAASVNTSEICLLDFGA